jgi:hypothetical protein
LEYEIQAQSTAAEIRAQVNLIQEVMQGVMQEGIHYGKVPGCGDKPTLLKPGAEKLSLTFHLRPVIDNDRDVRVEHFDNGHREVTVYCHIMSPSGLEIATGVGSCSTMESKYRYRGGEKTPTGEIVPKEYWNLKSEGKLDDAKKLIGGSGYGVAKVDGTWQICEMGEKMENSDIADTYNTVLKMAKKRAYVDGILSATGASDIYTQDIEDLSAGAITPESPLPKNPETQKQPIQQTTSKSLSDAQVKRFYKIVETSGATPEVVKVILDHEVPNNFTAEGGKFNWPKVSKTQYDTLCSMFEKGFWQAKFEEIMTNEVNVNDLPDVN